MSASLRPALMLMALVALPACALTGPPRAIPHATEPRAEPCELPRAIPLEGQPRGLVVTVGLPENTTSDRPLCWADSPAVALLRRTPGSSWEVALSFRRDEPQGEPLWTQRRLKFLDQELTGGARYDYAAAVLNRDGDLVVVGPSSSVHWVLPPSPPEAVTVTSVGRHIHVTWLLDNKSLAESDSRGALVFRRELGSKAGYVRRGPLAAGSREFVDDTVEPGRVYAYMISTVDWAENLPVIGVPSQEVLVEATPEGPLPGGLNRFPAPEPPPEEELPEGEE